MKISPLPENEADRLNELYRYNLLDTESEKEFEDIVELASQISDSSIALITLIDKDRQWFKARKGLSVSETNRDISFCAHAIHQDDIMIVEDASRDERFADNPFVTGDPRVRFYAGMPLITNAGYKLGTLCIIDNKPGSINQDQIEDLRFLSKHVVSLFDLKLRNLQLRDNLTKRTFELENVFNRIGEAFISLDKEWRYVYANDRAGALVKRAPEELIGKNVWEEFPQAVGSATYHAFHKALAEQIYICHIDYYQPLNLWQENHIYPSAEGLSVFIRDISQRVSSEKKLVESLESLERAEKHAHMGSWSYDVATGQRTWSKQLFSLLGFGELNEVPPTNEVLNRIHENDRAIIAAVGDQMRKGITPSNCVIRTNPIGSKLRYLFQSIHVIRDANERPIRFEGVMIDITEQKMTEEALALSEQNYRSIFENAVDGIYQRTLDDKFRIANPAMAKIFGYESPTDLIRSISNISQQLYPDSQNRLQFESRIESNGKVIGLELKAQKKDKSEVWVRDIVRKVYDDHGNVKYLEGMLEDITDRKLAELKLRQSEDKLRAFFRSTSDASVLLDKKLEVLYFNEAAKTLTLDSVGYELKEGVNFIDLIFRDGRHQIKNLLLRALQGESNKIEIPIPNQKLGRSVWWLTSYMPAYDKEGKIIGVVASSTNVDEMKRAGLKIKKQFEDLKKMNHELDRFVYSVSHDLRAPLSTIIGLTNVAELEKPEAAFLEYFRMIRQHVTKLDHFISEILDYSLNARTVIKKEEINFNSLVEHVRNRMSLLPGADKVRIETDLNIAHPFYSDKTRLEIVFNNLYSNAIKFRDASKKESFLHIVIKEKDEGIEIIFGDNGIGIEERHLPRVFDMFYRATDTAKGSGLGLYIARETINRLGGSINIKSMLGESTSVRILIPGTR